MIFFSYKTDLNVMNTNNGQIKRKETSQFTGNLAKLVPVLVS